MYLNKKKILCLLSASLVVSLSLPQQFSLAGELVQPSIEKEHLIVPQQANPPEWAAAWERTGGIKDVLKDGHPAQVQMLPDYLNEIDNVVESGIEEALYPGAVTMVIKEGIIVQHEAYGHSLKYADEGELLPENERISTMTDTIFDMASITKIFTSIASLQLVENGLVELDKPVATYLPEFESGDEKNITVRQLLTHTSGLPAWLPIWTYSTVEERIQAVYEAEPTNEPGTSYVYSDLNMILLGEIIERISGDSLDHYIATHITEPLGMNDTMFNPPSQLKNRIAATEPQPYLNRGMVWGEVHDENAYSLNGVAGHAGIFSTAKDIAILSQTILNGGKYGQARILQEDTVSEMLTNQITDESTLGQGLGWHLDRAFFMGAMSSSTTAGHTGFTGTSFLIDQDRETIVIFLTNRVHPTRESGSINPWRQDVVQKVVDSIDQHPKSNRSNAEKEEE